MGETPRRIDGYLPLESYSVIGDGWSAALCGLDGGIDWWCAPTTEGRPVLDRLLDAGGGAFFRLAPAESGSADRAYRPDSNVLQTDYRTDSGRARVVEGMLPGSGDERPRIVRRVEGLEGSMRFEAQLRARPGGARLTGTGGLNIRRDGDDELCSFGIAVGEVKMFFLDAAENASEDAPADALDAADAAWRDWAAGLEAPDALIRRQALILKLLCAPNGAFFAAATTSLPELMGGERNWDFRYTWMRDAAYAVEAFAEVGATADAIRIFDWLIDRVREHGPRVVFDIDGKPAPSDREWDVPGYRGSRPVHLGNLATEQDQHGAFGDLLQAADRLVRAGWRPSSSTAAVLADLIDQAAAAWREPDAGIWELSEKRLYTNSRISCWQSLARGIELADRGLLPADRREAWNDARRELEAWIEDHCWSEGRQAYVAWPGAETLDASLALAVRFGFGSPERMDATLAAIDAELGCGLFHHRLSGVQDSEGCFIACSFWLAEAKARRGRVQEAKASFEALMEILGGTHPLPEMVEPGTGRWLGNMPQGLTHIGIIQTAAAIATAERNRS